MVFILVVLQILLLMVIVKLMRTATISPVLSTLLLFFAVIWYFAPVFITFLIWDSISYRSLVGYDLFVSYAALETLMLLLTLVTLLRKRPYFRMITASTLARLSPSPRLALLVVLATIGTSLALAIMRNSLVDTSYYEMNAFAVAAEGTTAFNNFGSFQFVSIMLTSFGYACLLTRWPKEAQSRLLRMAVVVLITIGAFSQVVTGARVGLITPIILLILYGRTQQWSKRKMALAVGMPAVIAIVAGGVLAIVISQTRGLNELTLQSTLSRSVALIEDEESAAKLGESLLVEIVTKFDSFSMGAFLVRREGAGAAGWAPYVGSLLAVAPRAVISSKPVPGSADGTSLGHPSRLVAERIGMDAASGNVNVSPAAISIWQLGYPGLAILILVNAFHLQLINSLLLSQSPLLKSLALFLVGIPTLITVFTSPDYLIMNIERVIVVWGLLFLASKLINFNYRPSAGSRATQVDNVLARGADR